MPISRSKPAPQRQEPIPHVPVDPKIMEIISPQATNLVKAEYANLPAIPSQKGQLIPGFGNLDEGDVTIAYLKLLQGMSPETKPDGGNHPQGKWYQSTAARVIGEELVVVPLHVDKWVELWDSHEGGGGLLARSRDGIHWDKPNTKFSLTVGGKERVVDTKGSVAESGLNDWGSSEPGNPRSKPLAPTVYRYSFYIEDYPALGTSLYIIKGTASEGARGLNKRIQAREMGGTPFYAQRYLLKINQKGQGRITWFVPSFENNGDVTDRRLLEDLNGRVRMLNAAATVVAINEDSAAEEEKVYEGVDRAQNSTY